MTYRSTERISQKELHLALQQTSLWYIHTTGNIQNVPTHSDTAIGQKILTFNVTGRWEHPSGELRDRK